MASGELPSWAKELLRDSRTAFLATADGQGRPLGLVICYVFDGDTFYSVVDAKPKSGRRLRRVENIEQNPRISVTVSFYAEDWRTLRHVIAEGRASILEAGAERAGAVEALRRKYAQYAEMDLEADFGVVLRVAAERFVSWSAAGEGAG